MVSVRTPVERAAYWKVLASGTVLGVAVGSAVTMLVVGIVGLAGVSSTGVVLGATRPAVLMKSKCVSGHDDLSDAPGAYVAGGTAGVTSIGARVLVVPGGVGSVEGALTGV